MWTWCANVVWIGLLVCVGMEARLARKMSRPVDEAKWQPLYAKVKDRLDRYKTAQMSVEDSEKLLSIIEQGKAELASLGRPFPDAQAPAAAGTPPQNGAWVRVRLASIPA